MEEIKVQTEERDQKLFGLYDIFGNQLLGKKENELCTIGCAMCSK